MPMIQKTFVGPDDCQTYTIQKSINGLGILEYNSEASLLEEDVSTNLHRKYRQITWVLTLDE